MRCDHPVRVSPTLLCLLLLLGAGCGWLWPRDNDHDPARCEPACPAGQRCYQGRCQAAGDLGEADQGVGDARADRGQPEARVTAPDLAEADGPPQDLAPPDSAPQDGPTPDLPKLDSQPLDGKPE